MTDQYVFDLVKDGQVVSRTKIECSVREEKAVIEVLEGPGLGTVCIGLDFFGAFGELRDLWDQSDLKPLCMGACLYVYPSGMSRDMGFGKVAYFLEKGRRASRKDLVNIFDPFPEDLSRGLLATVHEQRAYRREAFGLPTE